MASIKNSCLFLFIIFLSLSCSQIPFSGRACDQRYCMSLHANKSSSFQNAQGLCLSNDSYLLELTNRQSKDLFFKFLQNNPVLLKSRILLNNQLKSHAWTCIDQVNERFTNFRGGKVIESNYINGKFLALASEGGLLAVRAEPNSLRRSALCYAAVDSETTCVRLFKEHYNLYLNNVCYFSLHGSLTWHEAINRCHREGNASLATFHHPDSIISLQKNFTVWTRVFAEGSYWIACASEAWYWSYSDIPVIDSEWFMGSPSGSNDLNCSYSSNDMFGSMWVRDGCEEEYSVVCMTDKMKATEASGAPPSTSLFSSLLIFISIFTTYNNLQHPHTGKIP